MGLWDWSGPQDLGWASASRSFSSAILIALTKPYYKHEVVVALDTGIKYQGDQPVIGGWVLADGGGNPNFPPVLWPMSFTDPVFAAAVPSGNITMSLNETVVDKTFNNVANDTPSAAAGSGANVLTRCRFLSRKAISLAGGAGGLTINNCWIETNGISTSGRGIATTAGTGTLAINNSTIRSHRPGAVPGTLGSVGAQMANNWFGSVTLRNVVFWGGENGFVMQAVAGNCTLDFENVFFVDPFSNGALAVLEAGGQITIANWTNVRDAIVSEGSVVPGALIPPPTV